MTIEWKGKYRWNPYKNKKKYVFVNPFKRKKKFKKYNWIKYGVKGDLSDNEFELQRKNLKSKMAQGKKRLR